MSETASRIQCRLHVVVQTLIDTCNTHQFWYCKKIFKDLKSLVWRDVLDEVWRICHYDKQGLLNPPDLPSTTSLVESWTLLIFFRRLDFSYVHIGGWFIFLLPLSISISPCFAIKTYFKTFLLLGNGANVCWWGRHVLGWFRMSQEVLLMEAVFPEAGEDNKEKTSLWIGYTWKTLSGAADVEEVFFFI